MELTFRNPTEEYFFTPWNWVLIRKVSLYVYLSCLIGMLGLVIMMIYNIPKTCNPPTQWYQGRLFYEIFPASFYSSKMEMEGNLKGIALKADYIQKLNVSGVRLNPIFTSPNYPKDFENATTLTEIDSVLGTLDDFKNLVKALGSRNMSLILDFPVTPFIQKSFQKKLPYFGLELKNNTEGGPNDFLSLSYDFDPIEGAMQYWKLHGVKGFYLKGLEKYADNFDTVRLLQRWKRLLGPDRIIIVSKDVISGTPKENLNAVLKNVDLVDVKLNLEKGVSEVISEIESVLNSSLFAEPGLPWVHWSIGNVNSKRLANVLPFGNATLGATLLQMMLPGNFFIECMIFSLVQNIIIPGTPSIFYGDEIGLHEIADPEDERQDIKHLHQLTMMPWPNEQPKVLPWIYGGPPTAQFDQVNAIAKMVDLRERSPSIYMNAVYKQGVNKANADIKYSQDNFLVIQRWYPRRKSYVVASNLGGTKISADLSLLLYTGQVIVGPRADSISESVSFKEVNLWPGESVVIVLD